MMYTTGLNVMGTFSFYRFAWRSPMGMTSQKTHRLLVERATSLW